MDAKLKYDFPLLEIRANRFFSGILEYRWDSVKDIKSGLDFLHPEDQLPFALEWLEEYLFFVAKSAYDLANRLRNKTFMRFYKNCVAIFALENNPTGKISILMLLDRVTCKLRDYSIARVKKV